MKLSFGKIKPKKNRLGLCFWCMQRQSLRGTSPLTFDAERQQRNSTVVAQLSLEAPPPCNKAALTRQTYKTDKNSNDTKARVHFNAMSKALEIRCGDFQ